MKEYYYIRAWGLYIGSSPDFIQRQIEQARKENAPEDSIFKNYQTNQWESVRSIKYNDVFEYIQQLVAEMME